jgi:hypothetical protein
MKRRNRGFIISIIVGALIGGVVAWVVFGNNDEDKPNGLAKAAPGDWLKVGTSALGLARLLGELVQRS